MKNWLLSGVLISLLIIAGCSSADHSVNYSQEERTYSDTGLSINTADEQTAEAFVFSNNWDIMFYNGNINTYTLDEELLQKPQYIQIWSVQTVSPQSFMGKEVDTYCFTVSNHPLTARTKIETNVYIMVAEGTVIGGYSLPNVLSLGGVYDLKGNATDD